MTVTVTADHIQRGERTSVKNPIALALSAMFVEPTYVVVNSRFAHFTALGGQIRQLPEEAANWMRAWDKQYCVAPFSFWLAP